MLLVEPFKCPTHWPKIGALDIGFVHKFAACELWHDRDLAVKLDETRTRA